MRASALLLVLFFAYEISATCYVSNSDCKLKILGIPSKNLDCGISCKVKETNKCSSVSLYHSKKDDGHVYLKATPSNKNVFFNITLLESNWTTFRIKIEGNTTPKVSICRKYTSSGRIDAVSDFQFEINEFEDYSRLANRAFTLEYEITVKDVSTYGKLIFHTPSFYRYSTPPINDLELFAYVDNSIEDILKLRVQTPSNLYNIRQYKVEVYENKNKMVANKTLSMGGDHLVYTYNATDKPGYYFFSVYPISLGCNTAGCYKSMTPSIDLTTHINWTLIIIISVVVLIMIIGTIIFCFRKACDCIKDT